MTKNNIDKTPVATYAVEKGKFIVQFNIIFWYSIIVRVIVFLKRTVCGDITEVSTT